MSWQTDIPIIVRVLINDLESQPTYSEDRILQVITVAAKYVQFDVVLDHGYLIDVANNTITPDPTEDRDDIFIRLVALKAACIIDQSTFRTKAVNEGIRVALGPAQLSVVGNLAGWKTLLDKGPCATYEELVSHWDVGQATTARAILSPFVGNKFDPRSFYFDNRGRNVY